LSVVHYSGVRRPQHNGSKYQLSGFCSWYKNKRK
jgi:hypothetical protein